MKKILFSLLLLTSCEDFEAVADNYQESRLAEGRYYKDQSTDICYFLIGYGQEQSITCVPCEKLTTVITFRTK